MDGMSKIRYEYPHKMSCQKSYEHDGILKKNSFPVIIFVMHQMQKETDKEK